MGRATDRERGAALVEFAVIAPLLLLLLFGIIEFGFAFRTQLAAGNGVQQAGRVGAALGNDLQADYETLQAVAQSVGSLPAGTVKQVHIFEADAAGNPTSGCPGSACNVYTYAPGFWVSPPCDWSPCPNLDEGGSLGGGWADSARDVALPGLDDIGVRIYYAHTWLTGGLVPLPDAACSSPPSGCWTTEAIFRLEPKVFEP